MEMIRFALIVLLAPLAIRPAYAQCDITQSVCALAGSYDPNPNNPGNNPDNTSPACDPHKTVGTKEIKLAFDAAPDRVKTDLCQVTKIFIAPNIHSWGRYNTPAYHPSDNPGATYIVIGQAYLNRNFSATQDDHSRSLSMGASARIKHANYGNNSDHYKYGLLYTMAHELGHIKWHQLYPLTGSQPGIPCFDSVFGPSWQDTTGAKNNRWTAFGADIGAHQNKNIQKPMNATEADFFAIYNGDFVKNLGAEFVTGLGSANPEEDFVEAYALGVVNKVCDNCVFTINFASYGSVVLLGRSTPDAKIACAAQYF